MIKKAVGILDAIMKVFVGLLLIALFIASGFKDFNIGYPSIIILILGLIVLFNYELRTALKSIPDIIYMIRKDGKKLDIFFRKQADLLEKGSTKIIVESGNEAVGTVKEKEISEATKSPEETEIPEESVKPAISKRLGFGKMEEMINEYLDLASNVSEMFDNDHLKAIVYINARIIDNIREARFFLEMPDDSEDVEVLLELKKLGYLNNPMYTLSCEYLYQVIYPNWIPFNIHDTEVVIKYRNTAALLLKITGNASKLLREARCN